MRTLTNDYRDSQVLNLGAEGDRGPYLVTQTGVSPDDQIPRTHMFVLRPDGQWVDFNAYACQGKPEAFDEVVFPTMPDVMAAFGRLAGRARVLNLPIDVAGLQAWIERQKGLTPVQAMRGWALKYKERHGGGG